MKHILFYLTISLFFLACQKNEHPFANGNPATSNQANTIENLTITRGVSIHSILLNWNFNSNGSALFYIYRSSDNSSFTVIDSTNHTIYEDTINLIPGKEYYYKVNELSSQNILSDFSVIDSGYILENYTHEISFGSFIYGYGVEFDNQNNIYVSDRTGGKVKVYDSTFTFLNNLVVSPNPSFQRVYRGMAWTNNGHLVIVNSVGGEIIEFTTGDSIVGTYSVQNSSILREVVVDQQNNFYITDVDNKDIVKLSSNGSFLNKWKMQQTSNNSHFYPSGLELINNKLIISGVNSNQFIEVFNQNGIFEKKWAFPYSAAHISSDSNGDLYFSCFSNAIIKTDQNGKILAYIGQNNLQRCVSVNVDNKGDVYASDENQASQIHVFRKR